MNFLVVHVKFYCYLIFFENLNNLLEQISILLVCGRNYQFIELMYCSFSICRTIQPIFKSKSVERKVIEMFILCYVLRITLMLSEGYLALCTEYSHELLATFIKNSLSNQ